MIRLTSICKEYAIGENELFIALHNINLTIREGELISIIGPSGSGKSTLIHLIGLLEKPTRGIITIKDKDTSSLNDDEISKIRNEFVGFVFQQFNLINRFTVLENVLLPTKYAKDVKHVDYTEKAMDLLKRFGILERRNFFPNKISGGQQQRTAIARALVMKPLLLLADEPTGNLDTKTGKDILNLLLNLNREEKLTIIIVTHDPSIAKLTKRKIRLVDGRMVAKF